MAMDGRAIGGKSRRRRVTTSIDAAIERALGPSNRGRGGAPGREAVLGQTGPRRGIGGNQQVGGGVRESVGSRRNAAPFKIPANLAEIEGAGLGQGSGREKYAGRRNETIGVLRNLGLIGGKDSDGIWNRQNMQELNKRIEGSTSRYQSLRDRLSSVRESDDPSKAALIATLQGKAQDARQELKQVRTDRGKVVSLRDKALESNIAKLWNNPKLMEQATQRAVTARLRSGGNVQENSPLVNSAGTNRYRRRRKGGASVGTAIS